MASTKFTMLSVATCLLLAGIPTAHAQVGGLIKKKVGEAVKGPEKAKEKAKAPDTIDEDSKLPFKLDAETKKAFIAGLQVEIDAREAFRKRVATLKTPQQFESCKQSMMMNPEGQKFSQDYMAAMTKLGDNAANKKPEQIQKEQQDMAEQFTKRSKALELKYCGDDPTPIRNSQAAVFERAQDAGALEFGKVFTRTPPESDDASRDLSPSHEPCGEGSPVNAEGDAEPAVRACDVPSRVSILAPLVRVAHDTTADEEKKQYYAVLKERVEKYCSLTQEQRDEAEKNGIKVPGTGQNIYWVFPRGFALWVGPDCAHLMKLMSLLQ